jgi:hypothetical protein
MKNVIDDIFKKAKEDFFVYLANKDKSLLAKANDLFNHNVVSINNKLKLKIILNENNILVEHEITIEDLKDLASIIKKKVKPYSYARDIVLVILNNNETEVFKEVVPLNKINYVNQLIQDNTNSIYKKIGKLDVTLTHNNNTLLDVKIDFNNLLQLNEKIKKHSETIYNTYLLSDNQKIQKHEHWYGHDDTFPSIILDYLFGHFIVTENNEFFSDENGNLITFE